MEERALKLGLLFCCHVKMLSFFSFKPFQRKDSINRYIKLSNSANKKQTKLNKITHIQKWTVPGNILSVTFEVILKLVSAIFQIFIFHQKL